MHFRFSCNLTINCTGNSTNHHEWMQRLCHEEHELEWTLDVRPTC